MLSKELQWGKAGEHLVCYDLIMQGYNAFLADQGLPYDIICDIDGKLLRIQVKSTLRKIIKGKDKHSYRFLTIYTKKPNGIELHDIDIIACVCLEEKLIGYFRAEDLISRSGKICSCIQLRDKYFPYQGRIYSNGTISKTYIKTKYIQDYSQLKF